LQYAVLIYRNRNQLRELRLVEMTIEADAALARLDAEAATREGEAAEVMRRAEAAYEQGREKFFRLRAKLPTKLRKLTAGCTSAGTRASVVALASFAPPLRLELWSLIAIRWVGVCIPLVADEMRTYWFEIFECGRKVALVCLPVFFSPGSPGQLILGLVICFITCTTRPGFESRHLCHCICRRLI
jgi:hypothetical protein